MPRDALTIKLRYNIKFMNATFFEYLLYLKKRRSRKLTVNHNHKDNNNKVALLVEGLSAGLKL